MKKKLENEKGQAIIEFLLFVPFVLMMYSLVVSIGNAINGSINQQKAVRGYLYYRVQNDSTVPKRHPTQNVHEGWTRFGMYFIGWKEKFDGNTPVATCYKFKLPTGTEASDNCDATYSGKTSQFVRLQTVYGLCGATYSNTDGRVFRGPYASPGEVVDQASCHLQ